MKFQLAKKYLPFILALFMLPAINAHAADAATAVNEIPSKEVVANMTKEQKEARLEEIKARVNEIKTMDRSNLSRQERKALRKELRSMHKQARAITGVYISVGALIIIILLLIIII
jgi:hypothetical protein